MKQTVTQSMFLDAFRDTCREDQFSYDALHMIFDFIEEIDEDAELDIVAICCEYQEMTEEELRNQYDIGEDQDCEDYLQDNTCYIGKTDNTFVFVQF